MNDREMLLRRLSSSQFAAWEMKMYLDTHPSDEKALISLKKYQLQTDKLMQEFEEKYGPLVTSNVMGDTSWEWINDPWPWEYQEGVSK